MTIQGVEPHLGISLYLALICSLFLKNEKLDFFFVSGKSDFPWQHFHNGKIPSPDYFWELNFYLSTDFHNFCGTF